MGPTSVCDAKSPSQNQQSFSTLETVKHNSSQGSTRAPDPRPARTRAAILNAVERLGVQGKELSVSAIVSEASLSRSSFYSQFKDLGDIAVQLIGELRDNPLTASDNHDANPDGHSSALNFLPLLTEFKKRSALYAAVLTSTAATGAQFQIHDILAEWMLPSVAAHAPKDIDPSFAARFISSGCLSSIVDWLNSEKPTSLDQVGNDIRALLPSWLVVAKE